MGLGETFPGFKEQTVIECIKVEVELVPWGRSCLAFVLSVFCKDFGMLVLCSKVLLPLRMAGVLDFMYQRDAGSMLQTKGITSFLL